MIAFAAGVLISVLELLCTGQIYLPTLMYIWGVEGLRARAFGLLVLYVSMFTLPILAIVVIAYAGVSSDKIVRFAHKQTAGVKLGTTGLFLVLSAYLVVVTGRVFSWW